MRPRSNRASAATRSHVSFHGSNWISIPDKPTRNSEKSYFQSRSWSFALQGIEESCHEQLMRESTPAILAASLFEPHGLVRLSSKAFLPTCGSFPVEQYQIVDKTPSLLVEVRLRISTNALAFCTYQAARFPPYSLFAGDHKIRKKTLRH